MSPRNRPRNIPTAPRTPGAEHTPAALAEVVEVRVAHLGPQHLGHRVEVTDRYDGMIGPAAGTLVGYRPAETPAGYNVGMLWRQLLLGQGPGKGESPVVREIDTIRLAL